MIVPHPRVALRLWLAVWLSASLAPGSLARDLTPSERLSDFDQLVEILRGDYGMLQYKRETLGVDIDRLVEQYRPRVQASASDEEMYGLFSAFVAEFKDAHLGHYRPSSMSASLGFSVRRIEERAIITEISEKVLPASTFPFKVGDELVAIDGKPVERILESLLPQNGNGRVESALGQVTAYLTRRHGVFGPVPTGACRLDIKPRGSSQAQSIVLTWIVQGKPLPGASFYGGGGHREIPGLTVGRPGWRRPDLAINPRAAVLPAVKVPGWFPDGAHTVASELFTACTFESSAGAVGYIRITDFMPDDATASLKEFRRIIKEQMWFTRGLVIDLNDNPGGSLFYVLALAGVLTDRPLEIPVWAVRANRANLAGLRGWAQQVTDPMQRTALENQADLVHAALEQGMEMTPFAHGWGRTTQAPDTEVKYTKPVLVLINDQCYSGGDMFPSLLQDNGRAKLFGRTTGGAGGAVGGFGPLTHSGSSLSVTQSIWQRRPSGTPIENVGASPDFPHEITQADVAAGYAAYKKAYVETLATMIR